MKLLKIAPAILLTFVMLYIARTNSRGRPEFVSHVNKGFTFEITTIPKIIEYQSDSITLRVSGPIGENTCVWFRLQSPGIDVDNRDVYGRTEMHPLDNTEDWYFTEVTAGARSGRYHYYFFEVTDSAGRELATFAHEDGTPFVLRYIGSVPPVVLAGHLLFIFTTVFFVAMAAASGLPLLFGNADDRPMAVYLFWAAVCCFLGSYPFGIPMNHYAFGTLWEGVPFGTDATDNKAQLLLVYLLFATLVWLRTLTQGRFGRDLYSARMRVLIGVGSFVVMLFIYLIPHSIQFSATLTNSFCYSWIVIIVLLYLIGLLRSKHADGVAA